MLHTRTRGRNQRRCCFGYLDFDRHGLRNRTAERVAKASVSRIVNLPKADFKHTPGALSENGATKSGTQNRPKCSWLPVVGLLRNC
jgi:hypothetical protein